MDVEDVFVVVVAGEQRRDEVRAVAADPPGAVVGRLHGEHVESDSHREDLPVVGRRAGRPSAAAVAARLARPPDGPSLGAQLRISAGFDHDGAASELSRGRRFRQRQVRSDCRGPELDPCADCDGHSGAVELGRNAGTRTYADADTRCPAPRGLVGTADHDPGRVQRPDGEDGRAARLPRRLPLRRGALGRLGGRPRHRPADPHRVRRAGRRPGPGDDASPCSATPTPGSARRSTSSGPSGSTRTPARRACTSKTR